MNGLGGAGGQRAQQHAEEAKEYKQGKLLQKQLVVVIHVPEMSLMLRTAIPMIANVSLTSQ